MEVILSPHKITMTQEFFNRIESQQARAENEAYKNPQKSIWGSSITINPTTRINRINGEGSTHFHKNRGEEYILIDGQIIVYRASLSLENIEKTIASMKETIMNPGDKIFISPNTVHTAINISPQDSTFLEITHGPYEDNDSHRVYDKAGRDKELANKWSSLGYPQGLSIQELIPLVKSNLMKKDSEWLKSEEDAKVVVKPWGREIWLNYNKGEEVGDKQKKYAYKKIHIKAGTKTSFQYHDKKQETNFILQGQAEAWFENDKGEIEKKVVNAGQFWTIEPPRKHRIIALTDLVLLEVSTPEVDDVIRLSDDYQRGDGRIQDEHKVI